MTTVRVLRPSPKVQTAKSSRKKMTIKPEGADWEITVPYAPREVTHSNLASAWDEISRATRSPLVMKSGDPQPRMNFTLFFGGLEWEDRQDDNLRKLMQIARDKRRVSVSYSTWETGVWRINDFQFQSTMRHPETGEITRAEVQIEFILAEDVSQHMGPLTGGVKNPTSGGEKKPKKQGRNPKKGSGRPRKYKVKKGDTLSEIAVKFYRDASKWRKIADANKIRNPRKLRVGQVLRLP